MTGMYRTRFTDAYELLCWATMHRVPEDETTICKGVLEPLALYTPKPWR